MYKRGSVLIFALVLLCTAARADVSIETAVSRSRLPVGEQLVLDIIISDANGRIEQPRISSIEGFTSYSQGHSQELSIINGQSSSRSIYSYVLVANSTGEKIIGPFQVVIGGREYKVAPVKVEVTQSAPAQPSAPWSQGPVAAPSPRAMPSGNVSDQDVFVKAWLDKDEVYVNEPVTITYTLFTRLSATYKGFEKEPVTTGFWVEDFPPDKTIRRTEQFLNGQRYVVADVRKLALFPTQAGVFTVDPGTLSASVELRDSSGFQTFFSSNIFGSRRVSGFPNQFISEVVEKTLVTDPVRLLVKALPEVARPVGFSGAVGQYEIESSLDKNEVEAGDPVTLRVRIRGQGNINTVQAPKLPKMDDFKVYESSSSTNISKERLLVEGEKITETVIVPRRPGTYRIPPMPFVYFEPKSGVYKTAGTPEHTLRVTGTAQPEPPPSSQGLSAADSIFEPADSAEVDLVAKDIRYIRLADEGPILAEKELYRSRLYWLLNLALFLAGVAALVLSNARAGDAADVKGSRRRRSHAAARARLKAASQLAKKNDSGAFYAEISRATVNYFADKFGLAPQGLSLHRVEELAAEHLSAEQMNKIRKLFEEMSMGRYSRAEKGREDMEELLELADQVITAFEKVRLK